MAQELRVNSGVWSDVEKGKKGHFTAKTAYGKKFFVHKNLMEQLGYTSEKNENGEYIKPVKFPFYAVVDNEKIGKLDKNGDPLVKDGEEVRFDREAAQSVFATLEEMEACAAEERSISTGIEIAVEKRILSKASSANLSEEAVKRLLANSPLT